MFLYDYCIAPRMPMCILPSPINSTPLSVEHIGLTLEGVMEIACLLTESQSDGHTKNGRVNGPVE